MTKTILAMYGGSKTRELAWPKRGQFDSTDKLAVSNLFDESIATGEKSP